MSPKELSRVGIFQSRILLRAGIDYVGYVWLKTSDFDGQVTFALEQDSSAVLSTPNHPSTRLKDRGASMKYTCVRPSTIRSRDLQFSSKVADVFGLIKSP
jgi:hypothetical protein